mgnify:CR=1 FL=1
MNDANSFLVDWSIRFFENKDSIKNEIVNIERNKDVFDFTINYKDKINYFIIVLSLENNIFDSLKTDNYYGIITLNNPVNIRFVINEWKKLADFKFLSIYFVNPFSGSEKVWTINPNIHDKVCDIASLELGLRTMAEMVAPIGIEELNNKIKLLKEESGQ